MMILTVVDTGVLLPTVRRLELDGEGGAAGEVSRGFVVRS